MIGRLIQHEQVGLFQQQAGQGDAHLPATGKLPAGAFEVGLAEPQSEENAFRLVAELVRLQVVEQGGEVTVALEALLVVGGSGIKALQFQFALVQVVAMGLDIAGGRLHLVDDEAVRGNNGHLGKVTNGHVRSLFHGEAVRLLEPVEDLEKGGLAAPVGPHQTGPCPGGHHEGGLAEQDLRPEGEVEIVDGQEHVSGAECGTNP